MRAVISCDDVPPCFSMYATVVRLSMRNRTDFDIHANRHINWLEMEAVRLTIDNQVRNWKSKLVRFLIDNRTTVAYIEKQGGTSSQEMTALTRRLLESTRKHNITLTAATWRGRRTW